MCKLAWMKINKYYKIRNYNMPIEHLLNGIYLINDGTIKINK